MKLSIAILTAFVGFSMAFAVPNAKDLSEQAVADGKHSLVQRNVYCPSNKPTECCGVSLGYSLICISVPLTSFSI